MARADRWQVLAMGCLAMLAACQMQTRESASQLDIVGARLENRTRSWVSTASVGVPATGRFVSCGNIAPGAECATSFPELTWSGNPVEVTWSQAGQVWSTGELTVQPGQEVFAAGRAVVRVVITGPGQAGVLLLPHSGP